MLLGYVPKSNNKLRVVGKGSGGLAEVRDQLNEGKVQYAFLKQVVNGMKKFVYIAWCGEGVTGMLKGSFNNHAVQLGNDVFKVRTCKCTLHPRCHSVLRLRAITCKSMRAPRRT